MIQKKRIFLYIFLSTTALLFLIPAYGVIMNSLKSLKELSINQWGLPNEWRFDNYLHVWLGNVSTQTSGVAASGMRDYFLNSFKVTIPALIGVIFISLLLAFPLARFKLKFNNLIYSVIVFGVAVPHQIMIIPIFKMLDLLYLYDTVWGLILVYVGFGIPFTTFFLRNFLIQIPFEIQEAAYVEGATMWTIFSKIIIPLCRPAIGVMIIIQFRNIFNEFLYAYILTNSQNVSTMPVAVALFSSSGYAALWHYQSASAIILTLPTLIIFLVFQKYFVSGLTAGSVKG